MTRMSGSRMDGKAANRGSSGVDLQQSINELRNLKFAIDEASIVAITDHRGIITYANKKFCEVSKYSEEELIGQDHRIINSGYHPKSFIRNLWQTIVQGKVWKGELRNRAKDGSVYWVDTTIVPFLNEEKKPYQYVAIRHEITNRKRVEQRLAVEQAVVLSFTEPAKSPKESLEKILVALSGPLEACFSKIFLFDKNGQPRCEAIWSSGDSTPEILKAAILQIRSKPLDAPSPEVLNRKTPVVHSLYRNTGDRNQSSSKDDHLRGIIEFPISYEGQLLGVLHVFSHEMFHLDQGFINTLNTLGNQIGQFLVRKRMELAIQESEEKLKYFEEKLRQGEKLMLLGMLASEIAHEVGTPLNIISGRVELLSAKEATNDAVKRDLDIINQQIERITKIIRSSLDITRRRKGTAISLQLNPLILSIAEFLRPQLDKHSIEFKINLPKNLVVTVDEDQMQQVFLNVLVNAIQAMPGGGKISIHHQKIAQNGVEYHDIQIQDTGKGIPSDELRLIFEPFYTSKKETGGTGLGLPVVKQILKTHGGDIYAESEMDHGSVIHILLPKPNL